MTERERGKKKREKQREKAPNHHGNKSKPGPVGSKILQLRVAHN